MAIVTIKGSLVGMRYYGFTAQAAALAMANKPTLKRDHANAHDLNAVAVFASGKQIGHVDRRHAAFIASAMDAGDKVSLSLDADLSPKPTFVPVVFHIDRLLGDRNIPIVCDANTVGIYLIHVRGAGRSYVGQSVDIQGRIVQHWDALRRGLHDNGELRSLWRSQGGSDFAASVLERAPKAIDGLSLARWLVERESWWIKEYGGLRKTINVREPSIVLDSKAKAQLESERIRARPEITNLANQTGALRQQIGILESGAAELELDLQKMAGFFSLFASADAKAGAARARISLPRMRQKIAALEVTCRDLEKRHYELKARVFL